MTADSVLTISPNVLVATIGATAAVIGAVLAAFTMLIRLLLSQTVRQVGAKIDAHEKLREQDREQIEDLQRQLDHTTRILPIEYVRREDWIRFGANIDAKLDRLADLIYRGSERGSRP